MWLLGLSSVSCPHPLLAKQLFPVAVNFYLLIVVFWKIQSEVRGNNLEMS